MKIIDAINKIDALKPNIYSQEEKVAWLAELDGQIHKNIIMTHEHTEEQEAFDGYGENVDPDTVLLVPAPHDQPVYLSWLQSKIDYFNGEYARYNNSKIAFNDAYSEFNNYYNRNNMPIGSKIRYF